MGLIRGVARTAVIAGTATAVSNRVSRRQANRWASQEQQAAPPEQQAPPPQQVAAPDPVEQLQRLGELRASGVLTEAEFQAQKQRILAA
ncbi:SHOCT domain-containing protein [Amnibacterium sp.]|uniref:SHOCT domain-containing protein n=1 Tax=Amnibacterium sp. TaxID=1872496 RepID=UPI003F7BD941